MSRQFNVPIILPADPTQLLEATTKQYVDNLVLGAGNVGASGMRSIVGGSGNILATTGTFLSLPGDFFPTRASAYPLDVEFTGSVAFFPRTTTDEINVAGDILWQDYYQSQQHAFYSNRGTGLPSYWVSFALNGNYQITSQPSVRQISLRAWSIPGIVLPIIGHCYLRVSWRSAKS